VEYTNLTAEIEKLHALALKGRDQVNEFYGYLIIWGTVIVVQGLLESQAAGWAEAPIMDVAAALLGCVLSLVLALRQRRTVVGRTWRSEIVAAAWVVVGANIFLLDLGREWFDHWPVSAPKASLAMLISLSLAVTAAATRRPFAVVGAVLWLALGFLLTLTSHPSEQSFELVGFALLTLIGYGVVLWRFPNQRYP
jgi:hypothetical protein